MADNDDNKPYEPKGIKIPITPGTVTFAAAIIGVCITAYGFYKSAIEDAVAENSRSKDIQELVVLIKGSREQQVVGIAEQVRILNEGQKKNAGDASANFLNIEKLEKANTALDSKMDALTKQIIDKLTDRTVQPRTP